LRKYIEVYLSVRVFKNKWFDHFAGKMKISDTKLRDIAHGLERGRWNADMEGDVYKVRVSLNRDYAGGGR
jgi:hypothetical protein